MSSTTSAVAIVTDSTCDIPHDLADALRIRVVPALLTLEGETYKDGQGISRPEFYKRLPSLAEPAMTAAPSPMAFEAVYESALTSGAEHIVSIHVSSRLSGIFSSASQAAKSFGDRVRALDSRHVSMALGFQTILAAEASLEGAALDAVLRVADQAKQRARLIAFIDTLEYLKRSGRVTGLRAGLGDLLKVKLLIMVVEGLVERIDQIRTRSRALDKLVSIARSWGRLERLAVLHSGVPQEARAFTQQLGGFSSHPPIVTEVTPVIGAHVGPGSLGLAALLSQV